MNRLTSPLVSVVIRTRDRPQHVRRAVESVIGQTYRPVEVIVVDDGTRPCILEWPDLSGVSVRYLRSTPPGGRARAGNAGIAAATGPYIGFLDDDDTFSPDHLATLIPAMQDSGWQVGYSLCENVEASYDAARNHWTEMARYVLYSGDFDRVRLVLENYIPLMTLLFTREVIEEAGGFDEALDVYEDWDLLFRIATRHAFLHVPRVTAQYYFWDAQEQGTLRVRGTAAEREAYCAVVLKHWDRITPEVLHTYFTIAGQRLGGFHSLERELTRVQADHERLQGVMDQVNRELDHLQRVNRQLEGLVSHLYLDLESIKQSVGWKLLERTRRLVGRLIPPHSRRRALYYLAHRAAALCLREGVRGTARAGVLRARRYLSLPHIPRARQIPGAPAVHAFAHATAVDIVIPVFNALDELRACLQSVRAHTDLSRHRIVVIDDASTDPEVSTLLDREAKTEGLVLFRNPQNLGFVRSVNIGLKASRRDVVILNSDTIVTNGWLEKLQRAAYSHPFVGTATPLSNHASICSVPQPMQYNHLPNGLTIEEFAAFVDLISLRHYPEIPAGIGFCLYVKREVIDSVGLLDEGEFERGYAEDTDFCLRVRKAGFINVMDDATFIYHHGGRSFESNKDPSALAEKNRMIQRNLIRLERRHPRYREQVARCLETLRLFHEYLAMRLEMVRKTSRASVVRAASES